MTRKPSPRRLATEDVTVPAPHATPADLARLEAAAKAPMAAKVLGDPPAIEARVVKNVTPASKPRAAKPKPAARPKPKPAAAPIERVPAAAFVAELQRLGLSKSAAARALGVSPSLISEYVGHGRGQLMRADRWTDAKARLEAAVPKSEEA